MKKDKKFCIEIIKESNKDVQFYTGLPSGAVFDRLLSPKGKHSNIVYRATAKKWSDHCKGAEPGNGGTQKRQLAVQPT